MFQLAKYASVFQVMILLLLFCTAAISSFAQSDSIAKPAAEAQSYPTYTIRGSVFDFETGEPVIFAPIIVCSKTDTTAISTDIGGLYSITINAGFFESTEELQLQIKYLGYSDTTITNLPFEKNIATVTIELKKSPKRLQVIEYPMPKGVIVKIDPKMLKRSRGRRMGPQYPELPKIIPDADYYRTETIGDTEDYW